MHRLRRTPHVVVIAATILATVLLANASGVAATETRSIPTDQNADVHGYSVPHHGDTAGMDLKSPLVGIAALSDGSGYWLAAADGGVFNFGDAPFLGSLGDLELNQPIVAIAAHPSGLGYWLVASDGGIFAFGEAPFLGSLGDLVLDQPIVGMAAHTSANGYWLVAADGGVFAFGMAPFLGSMGGIELKEPVVGMAPHTGSNGYWLVASDGGIFSFGSAPFLGSTGAIVLDQPIVGMAATPGSDGYWMVAADGGVFSFGTAGFLGSAAGSDRKEGIVGMAAPQAAAGYWLVRAAGPTWPLTGLPTSVVDDRPALLVKIDNHPAARGQWGLERADIVFEELVEGGVTRFVAVFHSQGASPVGPIRSARETDLQLLPMFGPSLLVFSGGNATVRNIVADSTFAKGIYPNNTYGRAYYRTSVRSLPHNLLSRTDRLWAFATETMGSPPSVFAHRLPVLDDLIVADTSPFVLDFGLSTVSWTWDGDRYLRSHGGVFHRDAGYKRVAAANVVVLETEYFVSQATGSPVASALGTGDGYVLVDGGLTAIVWTRETLTAPYRLHDADTGVEVLLAPGTTWVELVPTGLTPFAQG